MGKGDETRRRALRNAKRRQQATKAPPRPQAPARGADVALCERPTKERMARGLWHVAAKDAPAVDMAADMIGWLHATGKITQSQEQAARAWQGLRVSYLAELPEIRGFKSCLHDEVPGFDDGDGNPEVIERYRDIEHALGRAGRLVMLRVCEDGEAPRDMALLRWALDVVERC